MKTGGGDLLGTFLYVGIPALIMVVGVWYMKPWRRR